MGKNNKLILKRELRKAKADLASLNQYLFDCEEILLSYEKDWARDLNYILSSFDITKNEENNSQSQVKKSDAHVNNQSQDRQREEHLKKNSPDWVRKIFRKIAQFTHPDKTESEYLNRLYKESSAMIEEEDFQGLFKICDNLGINYEVDPEVELKLSREKQEKIKSRLKEIDNSIAWVWGEAEELPHIRITFLIKLLPHYNIKDISEDKIKKIVDYLLERDE